MSDVETKINTPDFDGMKSASILKLAIRLTAETKNMMVVDTGRLRNAYMWKFRSQKGGLNDSSGTQHDKELNIEPEAKEAIVGANLNYAIYREMGTRYMAPFPAFRGAIDKIINGAGAEEVANAINEAAAGGKLTSGENASERYKDVG